MTDAQKKRAEAETPAPRQRGRLALVRSAFGVFIAVSLPSLFFLSLGLAQFYEETCPQRAPAGADGGRGPSWVGPTTFKCVYDGAPELTYSDARPLVLACTLLIVIGGAVWLSTYLRWRRQRIHPGRAPT